MHETPRRKDSDSIFMGLLSLRPLLHFLMQRHLPARLTTPKTQQEINPSKQQVICGWLAHFPLNQIWITTHNHPTYHSNSIQLLREQHSACRQQNIPLLGKAPQSIRCRPHGRSHKFVITSQHSTYVTSYKDIIFPHRAVLIVVSYPILAQLYYKYISGNESPDCSVRMQQYRHSNYIWITYTFHSNKQIACDRQWSAQRILDYTLKRPQKHSAWNEVGVNLPFVCRKDYIARCEQKRA